MIIYIINEANVVLNRIPQSIHQKNSDETHKALHPDMKYSLRTIDCKGVSSLCVAHQRKRSDLFLAKNEATVPVSYDINRNSETPVDRGHPSKVCAVASSSYVKGVEILMVSASRDGTIIVWGQDTRKYFRRVWLR